MPINEASGMRGYNPLIPKQNRKPITREQRQMMLEALYGRKREEADMNALVGALLTVLKQKKEL